MISITRHSKINKRLGTWISRAVSLIFWITIWHFLAEYVGQKILLPSPSDVLKKLSELIVKNEFWNSVKNTMCRIVSGFSAAAAVGIVLAVFSGFSKTIKILLSPFMSAMKSVPVASFVILSLIWLDASELSSFVAFVMVLPIIYVNVLSGIDSTDKKMLETAQVFKFSYVKKLLYVYLPAIIPFFKSGCALALGLCWKAGVAAELIGVPVGTIGEQLYFSKIYFDTAELFAWTIVIVLISVVFEKIFLLALNVLTNIYERL